MELTSTKFMTKEEKQKVINSFAKFVSSQFDQSKLTKALYNHLHLHCGFIAHYNILGFYEERFVGLENIKITLDGIISSANHCNFDYADINSQLAEIVADNYTSIMNYYKNLEISNLEYEQKRINNKINTLKK